MATSNDENVAAGVVIGLVAPLIVAALLVMGGFVETSLWNWFMPTFTPIKMNIPLAIGLGCLWSALRGPRAKNDNPWWSWPLGLFVLYVTGFVAHLFFR